MSSINYCNFDLKFSLWNRSASSSIWKIKTTGDYFKDASIGRVAVQEGFRGTGLGIQIMKEAIQAVNHRYGPVNIALSAQKYLEKFYSDLGFITEGKEYLEDGIPHIRMVLYGEDRN